MYVGPLEPILEDPAVMEVLINGPHEIYVERHGELQLTDAKFKDENDLMIFITSLATPLGRRVDESHPIVDLRLPDGSKVNIVIPPIAMNGPVVTIAKTQLRPLSWDDLIGYGTLTPELRDFLEACVKARLNIVVSGGTGSGKTTILNALTEFIPDSDRVVSFDHDSMVKVRSKHNVHLESRPPNLEGKGEISMRDLAYNALKMRPDRIIAGEARGGEVIDILQAFNTGIDGSMYTIHANTPRDAIARTEVMAMMSGVDVPVLSIRENIASAIDVIIQQSRLRDGTRKIINVTEVKGMENTFITMADIFEFEQTAYEDGKVIGEIKATGVKPTFLDLIKETGYASPEGLFED